MPIEHDGTRVRVGAVRDVDATVRLPGSKSLTNRYLLCTALADGVSRLTNASLADDALVMVDGLRALGVTVAIDAGHQALEVTGCRGLLPADTAELDVGNAGTAARFLTALACTGFGSYRIDGSPRMRERPIGPLVDALIALGAGIGYERRPGYLPVTVAARRLAGGTAEFREVPSSQFVSALLMVAPYAAQDVLLSIAGELTSRPYVEMTIGVMRSLGVEVLEAEHRRFVVPATQRYRAGVCEIEPDASAASYFWAAAAATGGRVRVLGLSRRSRQGDVRFADVLARMGCRVDDDGNGVAVVGPAEGRLCGVDEDLNEMPDVAQTLAALALLADGPTRIRNVANLRIKETDRLSALATEVTRLGGGVDVVADGLTIHPPERITPAEVQTYEDHRMAMSFAVLGLVADGMVIEDAGCVSKSFPEFFEVLATLG